MREAEEFDDSSVEPGVWRYAKAEKVRVIVDAQDYYDLMQKAMLKARRRILMLGWDFDTRIHLTHGRRWWQKAWKGSEYPARLGSFIPWLTRHNHNVEVHILVWSFGMVKSAVHGSMVLDLARWVYNKRISFKFDTAHPVGCSHHQKIAVIDTGLSVCGGIDMADRRWDTREHLENDPRRRRPGGKAYGPWHDMTMMMEGEVAGALDELGRNRWSKAAGLPLSPIDPIPGSAWPDGLEPHFENVEVGIARTRAAYRDHPAVTEIERLHLVHIARAKRFIYAENQYFASRAIAEAISARMAEPDPPEVVIVHPVNADGPLERTAMDPARNMLARAIEELDTHNRFHLYSAWSGETPIYIHAKLLIVDDEILRIGSANFNGRSMRLDSECDVFIDCARSANNHCSEGIRAIRHSLLAEHCGVSLEEVSRLLEQAGSMAGMIAALGGGHGRMLRPFHPAEPTPLEIELARRQVFDPESAEAMFENTPARRGLFRPGSLLARSMDRLNRKRRAR